MSDLTIKEALLKTTQAIKDYVDNKISVFATEEYVDDAIGNIESVDTDNLVVTNSISINRKEGTTIGEKSVAVGNNVEASGYYSHAEGTNTKASGYASHAEGSNTEVSGYASHAEGHYAEASGDFSHAEGFATTASGDYSHAEGVRTIASSEYQHVQGRFNIEDSTNTYAHIVGNGEEIETDEGVQTVCSNAHTLDWDGNAWFAGNVSIGADNKEIATKEYVDDSCEYHIVPVTQGFDLEYGYVNLLDLELGNAYKLSKNFDMSTIKKIPLVLINDDGTKFEVNNINNTLGFTKRYDATIIPTAKTSSQFMFYYWDINSGSLNIIAKKTNGVWAIQKMAPMTLTASNTVEFTPINDYQPATKKYVDDKFAGLQIAQITQAEYDALETKDSNTLYLIVE